MESHFPSFQSDSRSARARVAQDFKVLIADTEQFLRATAGEAGDKAREARARVEAALARARVACAEMKDRGLEQAGVAARKADAFVRARPYESLGIAFGVGVLLGLLVRRRD